MQSKLAENLKALRKARGWTQQALAERLGLTRPTLGAYEEGRSEPKLSVLIDMAACFDITVDALVRGSEAEVNAERVKGDGLRILTVSVDKEHDNERVVVVPVKAAAGYAHGYGDPEWVAQLPTFGLPLKELAPDRTYRMFQIEGDSMLPIPSGEAFVATAALVQASGLEPTELDTALTMHLTLVNANGLSGWQMLQPSLSGKSAEGVAACNPPIS